MFGRDGVLWRLGTTFFLFGCSKIFPLGHFSDALLDDLIRTLYLFSHWVLHSESRVSERLPSYVHAYGSESRDLVEVLLRTTLKRGKAKVEWSSLLSREDTGLNKSALVSIFRVRQLPSSRSLQNSQIEHAS